MKKKILEKINIPEGITCEFNSGIFTCTKGGAKIEKKLNLPQTEIKINNSELTIECKKGNKNNYKKIKSAVAHLNNLFSGLEEKFVYKMEACNVHFPMSIKIDSNRLIITNFLGEKTPRVAEILQDVNVDVKGTQLTISSHNRAAAGQTAANIEKSTKIKARDRRIYQDGIFITSKPGRKT